MKTVAVVYGGRSGEHEVSLLSAASVISELSQLNFRIIPIAIDKQGCWYKNALDDVFERKEKPMLVKTSRSQLIGYPAQNLSQQSIDVVFPVMHGPTCEDGCVQGVFEMANLPYVGAGVLSSAISMDKDIAKRLILAEGIDTAPYLTVKEKHYKKNPHDVIERITKRFVFPLFVKPATLGSSVGINKVHDIEELQRAIHEAFCFDQKILVEAFISGQEIELSVLESLDYGMKPFVSVAGEIALDQSRGFYSYQAKYVEKQTASLLIPASIDESLMHKAQAIAAQIFECLECEGMARVDLFIDQSQRIFFNEINTMPGFTSISMYPKLCAYSKISYAKLLSHLIDLALTRHHRRQQLVTDYQ